uniref:(northern house mosquito) hypothetical protein n=1 Tax=Culex pipiens TaxID=7175 RepID=A0A8D8E2Q2_CULPI
MEAAPNRVVLDPARSLFVTFSSFRSGNLPRTCSNSSSETIPCPVDQHCTGSFAFRNILQPAHQRSVASSRSYFLLQTSAASRRLAIRVGDITSCCSRNHRQYLVILRSFHINTTHFTFSSSN